MSLVLVNGSFGCRTIAARTRDLILDTILEVTRPYSTIPVLLRDLGSLTCESAWSEDVTPPPFRKLSWVPAAMRGCYRAPPRVCSKEGGEAVPRTPWLG